jgi:exosortase E/protease (VPEID-CTERM system)
MTLGTVRFCEQIAPECSGLEGAGLILAFSVLWLILFRRECRFPQSFVLIPLGIALMFALNVVRIATLILIGNAGAPEIAEHGFHSQAGWIAFSMVAVLFSFTILHIPWFVANPHRLVLSRSQMPNPTAIFLLPFLAILAAGMVDKAFTGSFDWLYPLKFFAAFALLVIFRKSYAELDWQFDWVAVSIGLIVFVVWVATDRFSNSIHENGIPGALQGSSAASVMWITFRVLAAVVTVPLAEELAFRGFLMRRLISRDFHSVSFRHFNWFALIASSIAFGLLHAGYRLAGVIAGLLFGVIVIRRGRFGEAVVAHATANALLAFYVLRFNQWHLW